MPREFGAESNLRATPAICTELTTKFGSTPISYHPD